MFLLTNQLNEMKKKLFKIFRLKRKYNFLSTFKAVTSKCANM